MNPDDPILTAYALGEVHDPKEKARIEAVLREDPALQAQVDALKKTGDWLENAFAAEVLPTPEASSKAASAEASPAKPTPFPKTPSEATRRARLAQLQKDAPTLGRTKETRYGALTAAIAACLALAGLWLFENFTKIFEEGPSTYVEVDMANPADLEERKRLSERIADEIAAEEAAQKERRETAFEQIASVDLKPAMLEREQTKALPDPLVHFKPAAGSAVVVSSSSAMRELGVEPPLELAELPAVGAYALRDVAVASPPPPQEVEGEEVFVLGSFEVTAEPAWQRGGGQQRLRAPASKMASTRVESYSAASDFSINQYVAPQVAASNLAARVDAMQAPLRESISGESYAAIRERGFVSPQSEPQSTFSIDVDTASYSNVRRMLNDGHQPPAGAVRIEELVNYFTYEGSAPETRDPPFSVHLEMAEAPWAPKHQLVRIGLKGYELPWAERPASNLVFLIDVSGSMQSPEKLPLVKASLRKLVARLDERDRVAIVTYAGSERVALPSTPASEQASIYAAIESLGAGGSTAGAAGIQRAYAVARSRFIENGNNRILLCTDGDFNVGVTSESDLVDLVERAAETGVYLSVFGFGRGNFQDAMLEEITNRGNGHYAYIDGAPEAERLFVEGAADTLLTIARDVKTQVEFNPAKVQAYRLIGYENRALAAHEFRDDTVDAGELGSGHHVTALYEIIPVGVKWVQPESAPLRYQRLEPSADSGQASEVLTVRLRYKLPVGDSAQEIARSLEAGPVPAWQQASNDFRWAAAVAGFGMILRDSEYRGETDWDLVEQLARSALGGDPAGRRQEFLEVIALARLQGVGRAPRRIGG